MPKQERDRIMLDAIVTKACGNGNFKVSSEGNHEALVSLGGKLRQNNIRIVEGDKVQIEVSQYDLSKGRIVFRYKE